MLLPPHSVHKARLTLTGWSVLPVNRIPSRWQRVEVVKLLPAIVVQQLNGWSSKVILLIDVFGWFPVRLSDCLSTRTQIDIDLYNAKLTINDQAVRYVSAFSGRRIRISFSFCKFITKLIFAIVLWPMRCNAADGAGDVSYTCQMEDHHLPVSYVFSCRPSSQSIMKFIILLHRFYTVETDNRENNLNTFL